MQNGDRKNQKPHDTCLVRDKDAKNLCSFLKMDRCSRHCHCMECLKSFICQKRPQDTVKALLMRQSTIVANHAVLCSVLAKSAFFHIHKIIVGTCDILTLNSHLENIPITQTERHIGTGKRHRFRYFQAHSLKKV